MKIQFFLISIFAGCAPYTPQVSQPPNTKIKAECPVHFEKNMKPATAVKTALKMKTECGMTEAEIEKLAAGA